MLRYLLVLLFFPVLASAQNELTETHVAVFFGPSVSSDQLLGIVQKYSLANTSDMVLFDGRPVVFVPKAGLDTSALKAEPEVQHMAPVFMNAAHEFVTYRQTFFVKLKLASDLGLLEREADRLGVHIIGPNRFEEDIIELRTSKNGIDAMEAVRQLKATHLFAIVSPNLMHSIRDCSVNDPRFSRQWNLKNDGSGVQGNGTPGADMDAEAAWGITMGDASIKIAILDSGIDTLHPDLENKLLPGFDAVSDSTSGYPTPNYDSDGHGTACAGIAAASTDNGIGIAGACPNCSLIPVRVFNYQVILGDVQPWAETQFFIDAINWSWQVADADVMSNSWGVPDILLALFPGSDTLVNAVIDDAVENGRGGAGTPMLFSSGNEGVTDSIPIWPARYANTIAVGATSMCDEHKSETSCDGENWWAGNWGQGLDVSAPGVRISTTDMLGAHGFNPSDYFNSFNGTSASCPNAAGTVGLILSAFPYLQAWEARKILRRGCEKVGGYDYSNWKEDGNWSAELGYGRINAYNSLVYGQALGLRSQSAQHLSVLTQADSHTVTVPQAGACSWQLFGLSGRLLRAGSGNGRITIWHDGLASGTYVLRVQSSDFAEAVKLIVP